MSFKSSRYDDFEKYRAIRNKQKQRHRAKYAKPPNEWTLHDMDLILAKQYPDRILAEMTGHGIEAVQSMRWRLKHGEVKRYG